VTSKRRLWIGKVGKFVGRIGEHIAYQFLKKMGQVTFSLEYDFELNEKPVEVKTVFEHHKDNYFVNRNTTGAFVCPALQHSQLCKQNGLYCFVLLRDDGYASVKVMEANTVTGFAKWGEVLRLQWPHVFQYDVRKNGLKRCTELPFCEWKPLVSKTILMTHLEWVK